MGNAWSVKDIPNQSGRNVIVTGANSGIGYHIALELAKAGACVECVCRNKERGEAAVSAMKKELLTSINTKKGKNEVGVKKVKQGEEEEEGTVKPGAAVPVGDGSEAADTRITLSIVDVSSLEDVKRYATEFCAKNKPLDILINNAGVMRLPKRELSKEGFEMQFATNHLGAFALTGLLLEPLRMSYENNLQEAKKRAQEIGTGGEGKVDQSKEIKVDYPRVVAVASLAALQAKKHLNTESDKIDFVRERNYEPYEVYRETKLANILFTRELGRRYPFITAVAGHPGISSTNLFKYVNSYWSHLTQDSFAGALPILRAATEPGIKSGTYFGCRYGIRGDPVPAYMHCNFKDDKYAAIYWEESVKATGVNF